MTIQGCVHIYKRGIVAKETNIPTVKTSQCYCSRASLVLVQVLLPIFEKNSNLVQTRIFKKSDQGSMSTHTEKKLGM